jgi:hypothetical protein
LATTIKQSAEMKSWKAGLVAQNSGDIDDRHFGFHWRREALWRRKK